MATERSDREILLPVIPKSPAAARPELRGQHDAGRDKPQAKSAPKVDCGETYWSWAAPRGF